MQKFYPAPEEIFTSGGRDILNNYKAAHIAHLENFRVVRSWFAAYREKPDLYEYMAVDYKTNTEVKERCRAYMKSRMGELSPLPFECPITHAKHHIPWPEHFVFEVIKHRKHEWRKYQSRMKKGIVLYSSCLVHILVHVWFTSGSCLSGGHFRAEGRNVLYSSCLVHVGVEEISE
jgi:hypothetical protein